MGKRFFQREDTVHLAIEIVDRFFLSQVYGDKGASSCAQTPLSNSRGNDTAAKSKSSNATPSIDQQSK